MSAPEPANELVPGRRWPSCWAWLVVPSLLAPGASGALAQAPLPAEALVAVVGAETPQEGADLVLLSDVDLRARLDLGPRSASVEPTRALYAATLDEIVGEILIAREAERLRATEPSESDVRAQRDRLVAAIGGEGALDALLAHIGADREEVERIARRRAVVEAFLRANLEGTTRVSDARVEEVFASGDHPFADMTLDRAREPLRAWLAVRALSTDVARWVTVLRERTIVRVLVSLDGASVDPEQVEDGSREHVDAE